MTGAAVADAGAGAGALGTGAGSGECSGSCAFHSAREFACCVARAFVAARAAAADAVQVAGAVVTIPSP